MSCHDKRRAECRVFAAVSRASDSVAKERLHRSDPRRDAIVPGSAAQTAERWRASFHRRAGQSVAFQGHRRGEAGATLAAFWEQRSSGVSVDRSSENSSGSRRRSHLTSIGRVLLAPLPGPGGTTRTRSTPSFAYLHASSFYNYPQSVTPSTASTAPPSCKPARSRCPRS